MKFLKVNRQSSLKDIKEQLKFKYELWIAETLK